jgi:PAS domain S-box-containing protein
MSPLQYQTKNAWLLFIVGLFSAAICLATWLLVAHLHDVTSAIARGQEVRQESESALSDLLFAESASRAFLVSGKESYVVSCTEGTQGAFEHLENVRKITKDNAGQQKWVEALRHLAQAKEKSMIALIEESRKEPGQAASLERSANIMAQFKATIESLEAEEERFVQRRIRTGDTLQSVVYILIACLSSLLVAALIWIKKLTDGYTTRASQAKAELESQVSERTTQLDQANNLLVSTANEFRTLANAVPQIVWTARADGVIDYANKRWYQYSGAMQNMEVSQGFAPSQNLHGTDFDLNNWLSHLHQEDRDQTVTAWKQSIDSGAPFEVECRLRQSAGNYRWFLCRATPIVNSEQEVVHWYGTCTDIDNQKNAMEQLSEGERTARSLFDLMPQLGWTASPDGVVDFCNARFMAYTGRTAEDMQRLGSKELHHPDHYDQVQEQWKAARESGEAFERKFPLKGVDGQFRWFLTRIMPVKDENGAIVRWVGINTDVDSEEKLNASLVKKVDERTDELRASELRFKSIFNNAFQFTGLLSTSGIILEANQTVLDFIGTTKEEVTGQSLSDLFWWTLTPGLKEKLQAAVVTAAQGHFVREEIEILGRTRTISCDFSLKPIFDEAGNVVLLLPEGRDISEFKKVRDEAIQASELKSQFVGNISHELRTPMSAILGLSEMLMSECEGDVRETAEHVFLSAKNLMTIVNDLLDFSKLEAGRFEVESWDFSVATQIEEVVAAFAADASEKQIKISTFIDSELPSSLSGDIVQIKNILRHLLHNAVKFTHDGEIKVSVNAVNVSGEAIFVQFGVTDSGIGIAPAQQKMIFQPFVQADGSTTRKYGGAGIGLVLSKRLVEKLGGVIVLESEEGKGSTFWFTIPLYRVQNGSLKVKH